jgi:glycosyltransferase involved in cell wall biosynthesis
VTREVEKNLVSVIITCYNQEQFICEAVESVLKQSYPFFECVIVDDGSTDRTAAICKEFAAAENRVQYIYQENCGVSAARNKGFAISKGAFIQFLDGDDYLAPEKLKIQVEFMLANSQYGITYSNHQHFWQSAGSYAQYSFEVVDELPLQQLLFKYDRGVSIPIHTAVLRRSIWAAHELPFPPDYTYRYEDWIFWIIIALKGTRFHFINKNLAVYRMHTNNFVAGGEQMAINALHAANYISLLIPNEMREEFHAQRFNFILKRYADAKIETLPISFFAKKMLASPGRMLKKVITRLSSLMRRLTRAK